MSMLEWQLSSEYMESSTPLCKRRHLLTSVLFLMLLFVSVRARAAEVKVIYISTSTPI
jgi:hypothetical protein